MTLTVTPWSGKPISAPGVYDLTMETYHGQPCEGPSISSSGLRTLWAASPAHFYLNSSLNPHREPDDKERPHFSLGRAAHHLLLQGRKGFDAEYVVRPDKWKDWRTADAREWKAEQIAAGMTIITDAELENIAGMARSLGSHPLVKAGILDGAVERSLIWRDPETGVWCKSRPDAIPNASGDFADLKTCVSVSTDSLRRSLGDFGYHQQGALVGEASRHVLGREMATFTLVWVEKAAPWCVRVTTLTTEDLLRGQRQNEAALRVFARCVDTGDWPGPGGDQPDGEYLSISEWTAKSIDARLELFKQTHPFQHAAE
jgi:hypothetical protein